jgi:hypothetical protein
VKDEPKLEKHTSSSTFNKKLKSLSGKPSNGNSLNKNQHNGSLNDSSSAPVVRNEIPDIFWQSVEPYCANITDDDIKLLENQLELNEKYLNFPKRKLFFWVKIFFSAKIKRLNYLCLFFLSWRCWKALFTSMGG